MLAAVPAAATAGFAGLVVGAVGGGGGGVAVVVVFAVGVDVFVEQRLGEAEEDGEEALQAVDGGAAVGELGELFGHGFYQGEVVAVGGGDDVAEEDEEGGEGVEEERPG